MVKKLFRMSDEDIPQLSAETFAALQEFYKEQEAKEHNNFGIEIKDNGPHFNENWVNRYIGLRAIVQLSQFWYDEDTTEKLVEIAVKSIQSGDKIALISCPTLYKNLKKNVGIHSEVTLFEYDKRFSIYGEDFIFYDYKKPLEIPKQKSKFFDLVIADPPFLSEECLTNTALTIKYLAKEKIIVCTGAVMADLAQNLLQVKKTSFVPRHKNNLANEFLCYSNFNIDES